MTDTNNIFNSVNSWIKKSERYEYLIHHENATESSISIPDFCNRSFSFETFEDFKAVLEVINYLDVYEYPNDLYDLYDYILFNKDERIIEELNRVERSSSFP